MASELRVDKIIPSSGTSIGIGTTSGTINFLGNSQINTTGVVTASSFSGSGANLTSLPAANLTGTIADARLSTVSSSKLSGALPALDGSALTGVGVGTADSINTTGIVTATSFVPTTGQLSNRNLIINGDYRIAQRATSSTTNGYNTMDRWYQYAINTGNTVTVAQVAITSGNAYDDGFRKAAKISLSGAGTANSNGEIEIFQKIEAQDIVNSGWNYKSSSSKITLSFWVKSSTAQTFPVHLRTEGGSNYGYGFTYTVTQANVWQKISHSVAGNSNLAINDDNGSGFRVYAGMPFQGSGFDGGSADTWVSYSPSTRVPPVPDTWLTAGASTFEITGVQLEVGPVATPFEHRSFGDELARCQRYYYMHHNTSKTGTEGNYRVACLGFVSGSTEVTGHVFFPVTMRANPSIDHNYGVTGGIGYWRIGGGSLGGDKYVDGAWTIASSTTRSTRIYATPRVSLSGGVAGYIDGRNSASYMAFNAEL
tara:strand:- start:1454 stop:2899 length:1446 start_codon:yes stop_codon:yes gene_type:complete